MSGKAAKGSSTSKCRRGIANSLKNKISRLKKGDITFYFHMPAHGNGKLVFEKQGLQAQQSVDILSAVRDHLPYPDKRLDEEFDRAQVYAVAVAAYEGNAPCAEYMVTATAQLATDRLMVATCTQPGSLNPLAQIVHSIKTPIAWSAWQNSKTAPAACLLC
jgi:hypothetical protein